MPAQREVHDRDGRWWNVSVRPYRTTENRIAGAVIALADVTALKGKLDEVTLAREFAEGIVNTIRSPLLVLNADLCVLAASPSFYVTFKVDPNATVGEYIYDLGNRQWDIPDLRRALGRVVELNVPVTDFTVAHEFQTLGRRTVLLNADQIFWKERPTGTILLSIEDVTGRQEA